MNSRPEGTLRKEEMPEETGGRFAAGDEAGLLEMLVETLVGAAEGRMHRVKESPCRNRT